MEASTRDISADRYSMEFESKYVTAHNESHYFEVDSTYGDLTSRIQSSGDAGVLTKESEVVDLVSDGAKILIKVDDSFYHFFIDGLPLILKLHKSHPDKLLVLYLQTSRTSKTVDALIDLLISILDREKVNYITVMWEKNMQYAPIYKINNYSIAEPYFSGNHITSLLDVSYSSQLVVDYARESLGVPAVANPYRKIYLTRSKHAGEDVGRMEPGYTAYKDDKRMDNPEKLETFFSSLRYEIIDPEKYFESLLHQIVYMSEVKTLVSISSSGLSNMIFMQPRKTVIELQAEIVQTNRTSDEDYVVSAMQAIHPMYSMLTFMKQHLLVSVPSNRDPDRVIEVLSDNRVKSLL